MPLTASAGAFSLFTVAKAVIAARDLDGPSLDKRVGKLLPRTRIDLLHGRAGDAHVLAALFLGKALPVDQAKGLVLVNVQEYRLLFGAVPHGQKTVVVWELAYLPAFSWPWHPLHLR